MGISCVMGLGNKNRKNARGIISILQQDVNWVGDGGIPTKKISAPTYLFTLWVKLGWRGERANSFAKM